MSLAQVFSCQFCEIPKNTFFTEHLRTTASVTKSKFHFLYYADEILVICRWWRSLLTTRDLLEIAMLQMYSKKLLVFTLINLTCFFEFFSRRETGFVSLKESNCDTRKNVYFTSKALFLLEIIRFYLSRYSNVMTSSNAQAWNRKNILLNNLGGKHCLVMKFGQFI